MTAQANQPMPKRKLGSVQRSFVGASAVSKAVLCIAAPGGGMEYVAVLQIEGISYSLKSEEERLVLSDLYQAFLCGLSFPVQVILRSLPLKLEDYLAHFTASLAGAASSETPQEEVERSIWKELAAAHSTFLEQLAAHRTLLDRRIYLIIRSTPPAAQHPSPLRSLLWPARLMSVRRRAEELERARQELDVQVSEITRLLGNMGLTITPLVGKQQLVPFYYSCLTALRAGKLPLPAEIIEGINRPTRPARRKGRQVSPDSATSSLLTTEGEELPTDLTQLADLLAPAGVEVHPEYLKLEEEFAQVLVVRQVPRVVSDGWLTPLIELDEPLELSILLRPLQSEAMMRLFRRKELELRSSALMAQRKGATVDPEIKVAQDDVETVIGRLASGEERMLDVALLVLVRGSSKRELTERSARVQSVLKNMLLVARPALFQQQQAFLSCLPHARNLLGAGILLDSRSVATAFPFVANALFQVQGVLEGITQTGELVALDAWGPDIPNANRIVLGPPGIGKSHAVKANIMRTALRYAHEHGQVQQEASERFQIIVIDPESEYGRMAAALGGQIIRLSAGATQHINPFDLPHLGSEQQALTPEEATRGDRLADHIQHLHTLLEIMLADHTPSGGGRVTSKEKSFLDAALYEVYRRAGITRDPRTHSRPAPLMSDLYTVLKSGECGPDPSDLLPRLRRYIEGSLAGLFSGPTTIGLDNSVVVFNIHRLESELRPIGLWLVTDYVWKKTFQSSIPRQLVVDEIATLYQFESGAEFLEDLVRRARKHYLGVTVITQHAAIFQKSAIPANAAVHILMRQDPTALDLMQQMFKLSPRETQLLRRLQKGEALFTVNEKRLLVRFETSRLEHILATTDPRELASWQQDPAYRDLLEVIQRLLSFDPDSATENTLHDLAALTR